MTTIPDSDNRGSIPPANDADEASERLESIVVRYEQRSDRRTVYPPGLSGVARASTWLTADADAFVDLEANR